MARYETVNHSNTDFFRWRATYDGNDDYSGEYRTLKNVRAGIAYDHRIQEKYYPEVVVTYTIQKLVATLNWDAFLEIDIPVLEWEDIDV